MSEFSRAGISESEREVMQVLWETGPATVRDVHDRLAESGSAWTRSTVITLLQRLEKKGYVGSDRDRFAFVFRPLVSREDLVHERMRQLADELCGGQTAPLLLAFAERQRFTPEELQELRRLVDQLASRQTNDAGRKKRD